MNTRRAFRRAVIGVVVSLPLLYVGFNLYYVINMNDIRRAGHFEAIADMMAHSPELVTSGRVRALKPDGVRQYPVGDSGRTVSVLLHPRTSDRMVFWLCGDDVDAVLFVGAGVGPNEIRWLKAPAAESAAVFGWE